MGRVAGWRQWCATHSGQALNERDRPECTEDRAECPLSGSWDASAGEQPRAAAVVMR
jgi:hypothetical protein